MTTIAERRRIAEAGTTENGSVTTVALQPIAAPSVLRPYGFAGATFVGLWFGKADRRAHEPGRRLTRPIELEWGEPGVERGQ